MMKNPFLESFNIYAAGNFLKFEELFALVSALQRDKTLKALGCQIWGGDLNLTNDENNQLVAILMKIYGLERLVPDITCADDNITVKAILRLNGAGRRYLIKEGSSIASGVEILSAVNDNINSMFFHPLENQGLCNRRAAETTTTTSRQPGVILDKFPTCTGKRDRAQSQRDKEPRRRQAWFRTCQSNRSTSCRILVTGIAL